MTSFVLKMIALVSMIIDHTGRLLHDDISFFNYIGRIAFPIFAFQITIGYQKTKNLKKYLLKLFIFALISEIPYYLFTGKYQLNVLFVLLLGNICMLIYDKISEKSLSIALILLIGVLSDLCKIEYGIYGIFLIMIFYIFRNNKILFNILSSMVIIIHYCINMLFNVSSVTEQLLLMGFSLSSLIFINMYNGKEGSKTKYLLYIIYPLHLLIFYLIKRML